MTARRPGIAPCILVLLIVGACRPGEVPRTAPSAAPAARALPDGATPMVRVGVVVDRPTVTLEGAAAYRITGPAGRVLAEARSGDAWTAAASGDGLELRSGSRSFVTAAPVVVNTAGGSALSVNGTAYRGELLILRGAGGVTAVNVLDIESYLLGVVPREIGSRPADELEAVKAQAVAARTYAMGNLGGREHLGFDFHGTDRDQVYGGVASEDPVADRAVRETRGEIITHDGVPILAYYSSTCGGRTAAIEESWPWRAPLPYLRSVSDEIPGTGTYYCSGSNRFRWTVEWSREDLLVALAASLRSHTDGRVSGVNRVDAVESTASGPSGRKTVRLVADGHEHTLRADSVRWVLRRPSGSGLNSSRIDVLETTRDGSGVASLTVRGGGWGHGIGMCQVGAMGRARAGQTYREILETYYTDTRIQRLY